HDRLARLEQKLRQLDKLTSGGELKDGPARDLADALAKGDLKKAEQAAAALGKQAQNPQQSEALAKQLDRLAEELRKASRNEEQQARVRERGEAAERAGLNAEGAQQ